MAAVSQRSKIASYAHRKKRWLIKTIAIGLLTLAVAAGAALLYFDRFKKAMDHRNRQHTMRSILLAAFYAAEEPRSHWPGTATDFISYLFDQEAKPPKNIIKSSGGEIFDFAQETFLYIGGRPYMHQGSPDVEIILIAITPSSDHTIEVGTSDGLYHLIPKEDLARFSDQLHNDRVAATTKSSTKPLR